MTASSFAGWVGTTGLHAVTESLVVSGVSGTLHHAAFHRFFSRARWCLDEVGHLLLLTLVALVPGPLCLVLDDTLCTHKGPKVFGLGVHVDPVRSTRRRRLLAFGHVWMVVAMLVPVPFSQLYRAGALVHGAGHVALPIRPWYRTRRTVSFADILRMAQRTLSSADWTDVRPLLAKAHSSLPVPATIAA